MFDANMRHLPKGLDFICEVWGIKEGTTLYKEGVRKGMLICCEMLDEDDENPKVSFDLNGKEIVVDSHSEGLFSYHFIYYCGVDREKREFFDWAYDRDKEKIENFLSDDYVAKEIK